MDLTLFLNFLKEYNGVLSMIATVIIAILTFSTVRLSSKTIKEMECARHEENRPYISFYINVKEDMVYTLCLKNFGKTAAKNINISITPQISEELFLLHNIKLFTEYKNLYLAPNQIIVADILDHQLNGTSFNCSITYLDESDNNYSASYIIDLAYSKYLTSVEDDTTKYLKEISKQLKSNNAS